MPRRKQSESSITSDSPETSSSEESQTSLALSSSSGTSPAYERQRKRKRSAPSSEASKSSDDTTDVPSEQAPTRQQRAKARRLKRVVGKYAKGVCCLQGTLESGGIVWSDFDAKKCMVQGTESNSATTSRCVTSLALAPSGLCVAVAFAENPLAVPFPPADPAGSATESCGIQVTPLELSSASNQQTARLPKALQDTLVRELVAVSTFELPSQVYTVLWPQKEVIFATLPSSFECRLFVLHVRRPQRWYSSILKLSAPGSGNPVVPMASCYCPHFAQAVLGKTSSSVAHGSAISGFCAVGTASDGVLIVKFNAAPMSASAPDICIELLVVMCLSTAGAAVPTVFPISQLAAFDGPDFHVDSESLEEMEALGIADSASRRYLIGAGSYLSGRVLLWDLCHISDSAWNPFLGEEAPQSYNLLAALSPARFALLGNAPFAECKYRLFRVLHAISLFDCMKFDSAPTAVAAVHLPEALLRNGRRHSKFPRDTLVCACSSGCVHLILRVGRQMYKRVKSAKCIDPAPMALDATGGVCASQAITSLRAGVLPFSRHAFVVRAACAAGDKIFVVDMPASAT